MERLSQDLRFAVRSLARTPGLAVVAILSLAFGIGANVAVFSLVNAVLLRPLTFREPDRLAMVFEKYHDADHRHVSGHEFVAWRDQNRAFEHLAMYEIAGLTLTGRGEPTTLTAQIVTADFFSLLGQRPILGRTIQTGDDQPGAAAVAVLGHSLWRDRFGGDSAIVGQRVILDDVPYTIAGVMPPWDDMDADLWIALDVVTEARKVGKHSNFVIGRLRPGVSFAAAETDLRVVAKRLEAQFPKENREHSVQVASLYDELVGDVRRPLTIALGAAAFVFLLACANVGHLLLTRAAARQKELAIRTALGAARGRLIGLLVSEALLLSIAGGVLGLLVAAWLPAIAPMLGVVHVPRLSGLGIDWRVLTATVGLCAMAGLFCGVAPALRSTSPRMKLWLSENNASSAAPGRRLAGFLVASEIALASVLLIGAGLTVKSFARVIRVNPGLDPHGLVLVSFPLPGQRYPTAELRRTALSTLLTSLTSLPGVEASGAVDMPPLAFCCTSLAITIEGKPAPQPGAEISPRISIVGGRYFDAMRIPVRSGRVFENSDWRSAVPLIRWYPQQPLPAHFNEPQAGPVAVISEAMAKAYWPNERVIGKRFRALFSPWITVIGVVGDVRQAALTEPPPPQFYLFDEQEPLSMMTLVVRTAGDPTSIVPSIRDAIRKLDRALPVGAVQTMDLAIWNSVGRARFNALLLGLAGALSLLLAVIGVYGVISYSVARRTREIGIRRALGAQVADVFRLVLGQAFGMVAIGLCAGIAGAFVLTRVLESLLYDVGARDPMTFATVALVLAGVALLATYIPGRAATRVDPTEALRSE